jgi:hypothetical protein
MRKFRIHSRRGVEVQIVSLTFFYHRYLRYNVNIKMTKSIFSQKEIEYLKSQRLARIVTAASIQEERSVRPDVVPIGFDFDGEYLYVSGMKLLYFSSKFGD